MILRKYLNESIQSETVVIEVMSKLSFGIKNAQDLFSKLVTDYQSFAQDRTASGAAINFAITAYHLYEWTLKEIDGQAKLDLETKRKSVQLEFQIIRDIANGSKHKTLTYDPKLKNTDSHDGAFSDDFSDEFDVSGLLVELNDGREFYFHSIADKIYEFWTAYYKQI